MLTSAKPSVLQQPLETTLETIGKVREVSKKLFSQTNSTDSISLSEIPESLESLIALL